MEKASLRLAVIGVVSILVLVSGCKESSGGSPKWEPPTGPGTRAGVELACGWQAKRSGQLKLLNEAGVVISSPELGIDDTGTAYLLQATEAGPEFDGSKSQLLESRLLDADGQQLPASTFYVTIEADTGKLRLDLYQGAENARQLLLTFENNQADYLLTKEEQDHLKQGGTLQCGRVRFEGTQFFVPGDRIPVDKEIHRHHLNVPIQATATTHLPSSLQQRLVDCNFQGTKTPIPLSLLNTNRLNQASGTYQIVSEESTFVDTLPLVEAKLLDAEGKVIVGQHLKTLRTQQGWDIEFFQGAEAAKTLKMLFEKATSWTEGIARDSNLQGCMNLSVAEQKRMATYFQRTRYALSVEVDLQPGLLSPLTDKFALIDPKRLRGLKFDSQTKTYYGSWFDEKRALLTLFGRLKNVSAQLQFLRLSYEGPVLTRAEMSALVAEKLREDDTLKWRVLSEGKAIVEKVVENTLTFDRSMFRGVVLLKAPYGSAPDQVYIEYIFIE